MIEREFTGLMWNEKQDVLKAFLDSLNWTRVIRTYQI